jgi:hypothetical protein
MPAPPPAFSDARLEERGQVWIQQRVDHHPAPPAIRRVPIGVLDLVYGHEVPLPEQLLEGRHADLRVDGAADQLTDQAEQRLQDLALGLRECGLAHTIVSFIEPTPPSATRHRLQ